MNDCPPQDAIPWTNQSTPAYHIGDRVKKRSGGSWRGKIVGWYRTAQTPEGYAVESAAEIRRLDRLEDGGNGK